MGCFSFSHTFFFQSPLLFFCNFQVCLSLSPLRVLIVRRQTSEEAATILLFTTECKRVLLGAQTPTRGVARGRCALPDATWAAGRLVDSTKPAPPTRLLGAPGKSVGFVLEECFPKLASVWAAPEDPTVETNGSAAPCHPLPTLPLHTCELRRCGSVQPPAASHPEPRRGAARGEKTLRLHRHTDPVTPRI